MVKWEDGRYNSMYANIGGFRASINWDSTRLSSGERIVGYKATFVDWTLKGYFELANDAKHAIERFARQKLLEALQVLMPEPETGGIGGRCTGDILCRCGYDGRSLSQIL